MWKVVSRGWSFASAVPGQMTHLVASLTLNSANSCVMQGASCTQRKISMVLFSIPFILSWGGSISSDSLLPSILLVVVIVVTVVIVVVILVVVVVAIVGVVFVVVVGSGVSSIIKLSFVIVGYFSCYWSSACPSVPISIIFVQKILNDEPGHNNGGYPVMNVLQAFDLLVDLTGDEDLTDEDGDTGMGDSTGVSVSLGGEISSGGKKCQESNISGGTIAGRAIIT
ncbi:hypothetical protein Tco_0799069 [Tanacetum coccineum]